MLAGIIKAGRTGHGTVVDAAIVDGSAHMMNLLMALGQGGGLSEGRGASLLDGPHWSRSYKCACGGYISVQALEAQFYHCLLELLGLAEDASMRAQHDMRIWPIQIARFANLFSAHPLSHWTALFEGTEACAAAVLSPRHAFEEPHMAARQVWDRQSGYLQAAAAPRFDGVRTAIKAAPTRDADRAEILSELAR